MRRFRIGDPVVYRKDKTSSCPGPRAEEVVPSARGEDYSYTVPKFWKISAIPDAEHVVVVTRTGKRHCLSVSDPHLHKASFFGRLLHLHRFPCEEARFRRTSST